MSSFENLKKKAKEALGTIADVSAEAYKVAEVKAKELAKTAKLNADITREKAAFRHLYQDLGTKYYEKYKDDPEKDFAEEIEAINEAFERLAAKQKELEELKVSESSEEEACDCCDDESCEIELAADDSAEE